MIRPYTPQDIEAVAHCWRAASELAHPFLTPSFFDQEDINLRTIYLAHAETWVTETDGTVIGFVALIESEVGGLFLDPQFHGRGYGRAMIDKAVFEKGSLTVDVFKANDIGSRFYRAYGFQKETEYIHEATGQVTERLKYKAF